MKLFLLWRSFTSYIMNKIFIIFCLVFLVSCDYSKEQKEILSLINDDNYEKYSDNFKAKVFRNFSKSDFVKLSSSKEGKLSAYFYSLLVKEYPEEAFRVFLKNIDNLNRIMVATSYDNFVEMTVAEYMLSVATSSDVFTQRQVEDIADRIIFDFENKKHLTEYVSGYFYKYRKNPKEKYYSAVKFAIVSKSLSNTGRFRFVSYLSNYNKPEDEVLITNYLENVLYNETMRSNDVIQIVNNFPRIKYFDILQNYYSKVVRNRKIKADKCYFELESFTQAIVKYKTVDSKSLVDSVINRVKYYSDCDFLAHNEHIYRILKNEDSTNYFSEIRNDLALRVNKIKLDSIDAVKNRWK